MFCQFQEFREYLANKKKIEMRNKKFNCVLDNLKPYLISKDNSNPKDIQEINQHYNKTDIIIIDNYEEPDEKYFILCFDKII